jgi:hypothetical protein
MDDRIKVVKLPIVGKVARISDPGEALYLPDGLSFKTNLKITLIGVDGKPKLTRDLGSGLITTAGVNAIAADFSGLGGVDITNFKWHDAGTGTTAAAIGDTALQTPSGMARVSGSQTNPTANTYLSTAVIPYTGAFNITEWAIFSASTVGTMLDHRVFGAQAVANGESIFYQWTLTVNAGG